MIRPRNFRELKKSIICQNQRENDNSLILQQNQHGLINQKEIPSLTKVNNTQNKVQQYRENIPQTRLKSGNKQSLYNKIILRVNEQMHAEDDYYNHQTNIDQQTLYTSPIKRQRSFLSPAPKNNQIQSNNKKQSLLSDPQRVIQANSTNNSYNQKKASNQALKFDSNIKRKLNFNNICEKSFKQVKQTKERFSSNKKSIPGNISFKSIIENSPQCKQMESQRIIKNQNSNHKQFATSPLKSFKGIESERLIERQNSLTKLKYQFAGIKKIMTKNQSQKETADRIIGNIVLERNRSQQTTSQPNSANNDSWLNQPQKKFENISFTKKVIRKQSTKNTETATPITCKEDVSPLSIKNQASPIISKGKSSIIMNRTPVNSNRLQPTRKDLNMFFKDKTPLQQRVVLNQSFNDVVNMSRQSISSELDMNPYMY